MLYQRAVEKPSAILKIKTMTYKETTRCSHSVTLLNIKGG